MYCMHLVTEMLVAVLNVCGDDDDDLADAGSLLFLQ